MLLQSCAVALAVVQTVCMLQFVSLLHSFEAPVAVGQLRDSRGRKFTTIHPLQSLSASLPGAEIGSCKCSLFWQTHPLHLHGTPYKTPWNKVSYFIILLFKTVMF